MNGILIRIYIYIYYNYIITINTLLLDYGYQRSINSSLSKQCDSQGAVDSTTKGGGPPGVGKCPRQMSRFRHSMLDKMTGVCCLFFGCFFRLDLLIFQIFRHASKVICLLAYRISRNMIFTQLYILSTCVYKIGSCAEIFFGPK